MGRLYPSPSLVAGDASGGGARDRLLAHPREPMDLSQRRLLLGRQAALVARRQPGLLHFGARRIPLPVGAAPGRPHTPNRGSAVRALPRAFVAAFDAVRGSDTR